MNKLYKYWCRFLILNTPGLQSLRQSDCTPFTLELNCSRICSQVWGCSAEGTSRGWFHPPHTFHTNVSGSVHAGVWILDPRCTYLNWMHMEISTPDIVAWSLKLFQGLWLATVLRVARRADFATVNSKGERSVAWLPSDCHDSLLTLLSGCLRSLYKAHLSFVEVNSTRTKY
jgi:hypothetical protein